MKWPKLVIASLLLVESISMAAPISITSNVETLSSLERELMVVEQQIEAKTARRAQVNKIMKASSAVIGVSGFIGGAGYITSSAIPMYVMHRQRANIKAYNEAVARANAAAFERAREARTSPTTFTIDALGTTKADRSSLDKRAFTELAKTGIEAAEHGAEKFETVGTHSTPSDFTWKDHSLWDERHPVWTKLAPDARSKLPHAFAETGLAESEAVENKVHVLQQAILKMQRQQISQPIHDSFSIWMLGLAGASALGGLASAELVNQNSVEYYMTWPKLADPSNLDKVTCLKYAAKIASLDCSKAKQMDTKAAADPPSGGQTGTNVSRKDHS